MWKAGEHFGAATHASFEPWPWQYVAVRVDPRVVAPPPATANRHRCEGGDYLGQETVNLPMFYPFPPPWIAGPEV